MPCWVWWGGFFVVVPRRSPSLQYYPPKTLTWLAGTSTFLKIALSYWKWVIFHCHVSFQECSPPPQRQNTHIPYSPKKLLLVLCFIDHSHLSLGSGVSYGSQLFLWWSTCLTPSWLHLVIPGGLTKRSIAETNHQHQWSFRSYISDHSEGNDQNH